MCADTDQCALYDLRGLTPDSTSRARSHSVVPVNPHSAATPSVHDWDSPPRAFQPFLMAPAPRIVPDSTLTDRSRRRQSGRECQRGHICQPSCSASHQEFGDRHATAGPPGPQVQQHGPPGPQVQQHGPPGPPVQQHGPPGPPVQQHGPPGPPVQQHGPSGPPVQQHGPPGPPVQQHGPPRPPVQQHCKPRSTQRSLGMECT